MDDPTPVSPPLAATAAQPLPPQPIRFTFRGAEYFGFWIVLAIAGLAGG